MYYDILGNGRYGLSTMGAYTNQAVALDAALVDVYNWNTTALIGTAADVNVVLMNLSIADTLTSATIDWSINGVAQTSYHWTGTLLQYETDTIYLNSFYPLGGENIVKVWVSDPNDSTDLETSNDTILVNTYGCDSLLHGVYTIGGVTADFVDVESAMLALEKCGINGPIEFHFNAGVYGQILLSQKIKGVSAINTILFTSTANDASSVFITGSPAVRLANISNITFRYLTIGDSSGTYGVHMMGKCDNIEFYHCTLYLSNTSTSSSTYVFYKPSGSTCDNFRFIGNTVIGGYYGMYFYGQSTNAGGYNTNVTIDSNVFRDAYYYGYYFYYNDFLSFSYNTTTPRNSSTTTFYTQTYYSNHNYSVGNKWNFTNNTTIDNYYNYMYYSHYYNYTGKGYFANNEIIHKSNTAGYGMYFYYSKVDVYHNSVISTGPTAYSFYVYGNNNEMDFKNNQMIAMNIPIIVYQGSNIDFDYNNYYSYSGIIGQWEGTSYFTLNDWIAKSGDSNAISIAPVFIDSTKSLELVNYTGMATPRLPNVLEDIHGSSRSSVTTIGAYGLSVYEGYNLSVDEITEPSLISV